jgi:hypothetical protein
MHPFEVETTNCLYQLLALEYIQEKINLSEEDKKMISETESICIKQLVDYYKEMKKNPETFNDNTTFKILDHIFSKHESQEVEKAKKLLKEYGYNVTKKIN